ncbi:hypothetical protein [Spiroplasma floricola]|uniref:hypothetical protein n=1 Tax=Spiroplasma floricola TaxID=216937 RepID=UPI0012FE18E1|nr:hypothetical protein [Spiroplasma floricola]
MQPIIFNNLNSVQIHYGLLESKNPNINLIDLINERKNELKIEQRKNKVNA